MKIILLQDIPKLGKAGEIKDASDGYARNFLIPRGLAEQATPSAIKMREERSKSEAAKRIVEKAGFRSALEELSKKTVEISLPVNDKGEFYMNVTPKVIAEAIRGSGISEEDMALDEKSIRKPGEYSIPIRRGEVTGNISVKITAK